MEWRRTVGVLVVEPVTAEVTNGWLNAVVIVMRDPISLEENERRIIAMLWYRAFEFYALIRVNGYVRIDDIYLSYMFLL